MMISSASVIKYLFWVSGFMVFYAYAGYPLLLWLISLLKPGRKINEGPLSEFAPKVSLLISAYNEEDVIEHKIRNSLALTYPKDLLEITVISDGSSDSTDEIVNRYREQGVLLRAYEGRIGKTACLNRAVPEAEGEIIVFTDANSEYDEHAIKELVKYFHEESIGFVTGTTRYVSDDSGQVVDSVGIYTRVEQLTKSIESKLSSCVGADGAIFAIRKHLYQPLQDYDINDFVIPLNIIAQGFRGVMTASAYCIEKTAPGGEGEFKRQVRISGRTIRAIFNNGNLLNPVKHGLFAFELISHKLCKFLVPFFMVLLLFSNLLLINAGIMYQLIFIGQIIFYGISLATHYGYEIKSISKLSGASYTFMTANAAILWGWVKYLQGETFTTWVPTKR